MEIKTANVAWEEGEFTYTDVDNISTTLPAVDVNGHRLVMVPCSIEGGVRPGYYVGYVSPNTDAAAAALAASIVRDYPLAM